MKKCPKCKSKKLRLVELWKNHAVVWDVGCSYDEGILEQGDPYKVEAQCQECGHAWTLRGVTQVSEDMFAPNKA